ncbi:Riboflavin transporter [Pseudovibrio sp. Ad5]|uniref:DMT family transporter n=1 Tax=Pseudovibrio sp. Ad5 TaxID=989436 RepID=UPI0007AED4E8|nr:DMT family transporter [Pseudovibrio sp. Ad5]KZK91099.1 Riboflavin transporter [Pseudovibrio sp. Ad5]
MSEMVSHAPAQGNVKFGILWMVAAMFMFVIVDSVGKYLSLSYPVLQVVWGRMFFHLLFMLIFLAPRVKTMITPNNGSVVYLRAILVLVMTIGSVAAAQLIPVATLHAIALLSPMMVTAMSVPILGEKVGLRRWASILVAFIGALLIVKPGAGVLDFGALIAVATIVVYSAGHIVARYASKFDSPSTVLFHTALLGAVVTSLFTPIFWQSPDLEGWTLLALIGAVSGFGHYAIVKAFSFGEASTIAPFSYSSLIWAMLIGLMFFGEFPDGLTLVGAAVIFGSAIYMWHREKVLGGAA